MREKLIKRVKESLVRKVRENLEEMTTVNGLTKIIAGIVQTIFVPFDAVVSPPDLTERAARKLVNMVEKEQERVEKFLTSGPGTDLGYPKI